MRAGGPPDHPKWLKYKQNAPPGRRGVSRGRFPQGKQNVYSKFIFITKARRHWQIVARGKASTAHAKQDVPSKKCDHAAAKIDSISSQSGPTNRFIRGARQLLEVPQRQLCSFYRRAQKISPAHAGPSQREETPPVQGRVQNNRVGCTFYGQLKLAVSCDF